MMMKNKTELDSSCEEKIEELKSQLAGVSLFADTVLFDMNNITMSSTKADILAHVEAWKNDMQTIKYITEIND